MRSRALLGGLLAAVCHVSCQAILTAPSGSKMTLVVNPPFVEAHGGVSVVSALLVESIGTPVADGTVVQFFTDIGQIEEQGKTNDGVARVNFVSDARSGTANITAASGAAESATATITVGNVRPKTVFVAASPSRITDSRSSQITATVLDANGNPVANTPVFFTTTGTSEFMESGGQAVFTDNDGRAHDVLRTRYPRDAAAKSIVVRATTANGIAGATDVVIN
jgi:hypothetical protein